MNAKNACVKYVDKTQKWIASLGNKVLAEATTLGELETKIKAKFDERRISSTELETVMIAHDIATRNNKA